MKKNYKQQPEIFALLSDVLLQDVTCQLQASAPVMFVGLSPVFS